jgi:hypothetical protein
MNIEKVNEYLKKLGKRIRAVKFKGTAEHTNNIEFYQLSNGKMLIVFWDFGTIKSILRQDRIGRYTYQINGQEGTNTTCIYYAAYNYDAHNYVDITA